MEFIFQCAKLASHLVEQTFEGARRQVEYDEVPQEGPSEIAQNIKQMLEKSAAEDLPPSPLPEENAAKTQVHKNYSIFIMCTIFKYILRKKWKKSHKNFSA